MNARRALVGCGMAFALAACAAVPRAGESELAAGIRLYESGSFENASQFLQRGIDRGLRAEDQVVAHKYMAFIHCALGREEQCRIEFRSALAIAPSFDLSAAEAGHPTWGPAFRSVKANR